VDSENLAKTRADILDNARALILLFLEKNGHDVGLGLREFA
jgi:hypothetical protein